MASRNLSQNDVRNILNAKRPELVEAIKMNVNMILDYLIQDKAISTSVFDRIYSEKIKDESARAVLEHVSSAGENAFFSFKRGLKAIECDDSLLQAIEAEEEKRKRQQRQSWPAPRRSKTPSRRPMSDACANSEYYSGSKDDGRSVSKASFRSGDMHSSSESFKGVRNGQQRYASDTSMAGNSGTCSNTSDLSEGDVFYENTSLNDLNICLNARSVNVLLVGCKGNGKSSTGNSILGEKCFMYRRRGGTSKARLGSGSFQGESEDVQWDVKVVDTPGISPEMSESEFQEIVSGVKMLSDEDKTSRLDAIVLIWSYDHTDSDRNVQVEVQAFQSLTRLLGNRLYDHLVIAVTHAGDLSSVEFEEYIQELPEPLREIEKKCSGRLVTFENKSTFEDIQQSREKLCNIVYNLAKKNQCGYTARHLSSLCKIPQGNELRLALMGKTGVGKSSTGNSIIGCENFAISCLATSQTFDCPYDTRTEPRKVAVVDSPGVLCTDTVDKDRLADQLSRIPVIYKELGLHAMLLVISGRQRFTEEDEDTVEVLREVFGDRLLKQYTVIVITGKDEIEADKKVKGDVNIYLQNTPKAFKAVQELCQNRVVFFNNKTKDETIQRMQLAELIRMIDDLVERNGGPYIDELFNEGKAVAADIEARSKENRSLSKAKSTSHLLVSVANSSLGSDALTDEKQPVPLSTRSKSISGLPTRSTGLTPCSSEEEIGLPGAATASDDETFGVAENKPRTPRSQTSTSLVDLDRGASTSPHSPRERGETLFRIHEDSSATEERARRFTAFSELRWSKLWRAIRKKLRFGRRKRYTVTVAPSAKECWTEP